MSVKGACGHGYLLESREGDLIDSPIYPFPEIESI